MGETIKTKIIIIASMMVCSILLAGCVEEKSNTTINLDDGVVNDGATENVQTIKHSKNVSLKIMSNPSGAKAYINNEYKGMTPLNLTVKEGEYNIKILKEGYESYTKTITPTEGTKTINPKLKKIITTGTLVINSYPSETGVYINGKYQGITPLTLTLESGTYNIKISKEGYKTYTKTVTIGAKETKSIDATIEKIQIGTYENPAKVGDVVRLKTSSIYGSKVYDVSVIRYIRGSEADNLIQNANMFNSEPKSGYSYLLVKVKVRYVSGKDSDYVSSLNFKAYCNGVGYSEAFAVLPDSYSELDYVDMMPGGEISGWIAYEVPTYKDILIEYSPSISSSSCYIKLE